MKKIASLSLVIVGALSISACTSTQQNMTGAAVGGATGAVVGGAVAGGPGAVLGAAGGAATGVYVTEEVL